MAGDNKEPAPLAEVIAGQGLLLWAADAALAEALQAALQAQYQVTRRKALPADARPDSKNAVLLLLPGPAEVLCAALQDGAEPGAALEAVQAETGAALAVWRKARRRVVLMDAAAARTAPGALLAYCGAAAGEDARGALRQAAGPEPDPVLLALARERLQASPELRRLAGEFAAAAVPLAGQAPDPDLALQAFLDGRDGAEERRLLRAQQRSMYEQMEQLYSARLELEAEMERLQDGKLELEAQLAQERSRGQEQAQLMQGRLQAKDEVLQAAGARIAGLEQVAGAQAQIAAGLKSQVQQLRSSRSFRLMAPLRSARKALRGTR